MTEQDPKLEGMVIVGPTACHVGSHFFLWGGADTVPEPPEGTLCDCGSYSWREWLEVVRRSDDEAVHQG